jgi:hypothetical protein
LTISKTGEMFIREKNHYLRFTETKNQDYILNKKETKSNEDSVLICSELFLQQPKQLLKNKIIIASIMWTKTPYTKWYKNVMIALYDLHTMS